MQVSKWGNSLAVRLPKKLVDTLDLKAGDEIDVRVLDRRILEVSQALNRAEALERLKQFRGTMPDNFKFDREEANAR